MIKLRIDVDYPYPSRLQSFLFTLLRTKVNKNYLRNAKIIAKMINESRQEVMAYWFFTPQTTPDKELLRMLHPERHEVALHVANNPYAELEKLEKTTKRKIKFYTVHGTARLLARLMWRRKLWEPRAHIPEGFPLKSFYEFPTLGLDILCYGNSTNQAVKIAEESIKKGEVLHVHPEWLFQRGTLNHRGPYYETLKSLLQTDEDLEGLVVRKKGLIRIASYAGTKEYEKDFVPTEKFLQKLAERDIDVFTFIERKWCFSLPNPPTSWLKVEDNIAIFNVTTYDEWWRNLSKKTRNMVRKAEKSGVTTRVVEPSDKLVEGIWRIYNETPIRQGRAFPHFGQQLLSVRSAVFSAQNSTFIASFLEDEVVGFIQLVYGDKIAIISQILSLQKFWDKAVNNALVAKAIKVCADNQIPWVMYGRMGNHPTLDNFKQSNSFVKFTFPRYYIPLTRKGFIATSLGIHRELKDTLPQSLKKPLLPLFNWASRTKLKVRSFLR